jgi:outer membrane protein assembly factor BamB
VFAFNATTGKKNWGKEILLNKGHGTFEIQPQVADGRVYLANQYGSGSGGGVLLALNAPDGPCCGSSTIGDAERGVDAIGSDGAWERPLVGTDG